MKARETTQAQWPRTWVLEPGADSFRRIPPAPVEDVPIPPVATFRQQSTIYIVAIIAIALLAASIAGSCRFGLLGICLPDSHRNTIEVR